MKPISLNPDIRAPLVVPFGRLAPKVLAWVTLGELCDLAGIPLRVSGGSDRRIACIAGTDHQLVAARDCYVAVGNAWSPSRTAALRVLEVLAHGFHDYAARECVCGRGLFVASARRGRPTVGAKPMSARERMARMRSKRLSV